MPSDVHSSQKRPAPLVVLSGGLVSHVHTVMGFLAFFGALVTALSLHYHKVVKNHVAQYPDEWWPSVSATIGDWYPERNIFQVGIALMAGPRFVLVFLSALLVSLSTPAGSLKPAILLFVGVLRTFACGGWVYVTSTDDHFFHDIAMFSYLALTPPWMFITSGSLAQPSFGARLEASGDNLALKARRMRRIASFCFFACTPFMGLFFYRHNALRIPGAYSHYAYFEWGLIIFDLLFDAASVYDLSRFEIHIVEAPRPDTTISAATTTAADRAVAHGPEGRRLIDGAWIRGGRSEAITSGAWSSSHTDNHSDSQQSNPRTILSDVGRPADVALSTQLPASPTSLRAIISLLSDSYLAFCFWTALTALHPMIFYFSVYNLAIGGHEVLLVSQAIGLSLTLAIPSLRSRVRQQSANGASLVGPVSSQAKALGWFFSLVGQASWYFADPLTRLLAVAFSNALLAVLLALEWGAAWESDQLPVKLGNWLVGLLASNLAKYANHSNNPAWPFMDATNGGHNVVLLSLALLAVVETALRPKYDRLPIVRRRQAGKTGGEAQDETSTAAPELPGSFWLSSLGVGALLFSFHTFLTDSGTMIAWGWTGYPIKGPMAIPHGCIILVTVAFSSLAATRWPSFGYRLTLFIVQCVSAALLYFAVDWNSFIGAIGMALSLPPLAFPIISAAMQHDPIKVMLCGWLVANVLTFLGVLTVAYAFVPGGKVMRERTGFMLVMQLVLLGLGLMNARRVDLKRIVPEKHAEKSASLSETDGKTVKASAVSKALRSSSTYYICLLMALIGLVSNLVPLYRIVPPSSITPHHADDRLVTAGMWTVHFALDQHMRDSSRRMASIMKTLDMDLFGLVESDLHRPVFGNRDLTQYLAEELKMYADIGPSPNKNTWGAALFSKFPIINSTHHLLPSPGGELAPAIHAVIDLYGTPTHVIVSHNGQEEDPLDRELQTTEIARIFREAYPHPAIFLGYVVTKPHAERPSPYKILFEDGKIYDVEPTDFGRWCEYLGFRGLERISYVRVSRYTVTDTELQTMKLVVPKEPVDSDSNTFTRFVSAETYPESMRYPLSLIDPEAFVYDKHIYSPYPWPIYYGPHVSDS